MSELVLHLAKLCRTRAALTFATAVVLVSAVAIYVLLGHHRAGVVGSCLLGSFGAALGALSIGCTMSVAYGLGLKGQITEGIVSKVALDRFLAVVDGIVYRPSLFRRIFRREK